MCNKKTITQTICSKNSRLRCCQLVSTWQIYRIKRGHNWEAVTRQQQNICITFIQRPPNVSDVGRTLYKYCTNALCLLGNWYTRHLISTLWNCVFITFWMVLIFLTKKLFVICKHRMEIESFYAYWDSPLSREAFLLSWKRVSTIPLRPGTNTLFVLVCSDVLESWWWDFSGIDYFRCKTSCCVHWGTGHMSRRQFQAAHCFHSTLG